MADKNESNVNTAYTANNSNTAVKGYVSTEDGRTISTIQSKRRVEAYEHAVRMKNMDDEYNQRIRLLDRETEEIQQLQKKKTLSELEQEALRGQLDAKTAERRKILAQQENDYRKQALQAAYNEDKKQEAYKFSNLKERIQFEEDTSKQAASDIETLTAQRDQLITSAQYVSESTQEAIRKQVAEENPNMTQADQEKEVARRIAEIQATQLASSQGDIDALNEKIGTLTSTMNESDENAKEFTTALDKSTLAEMSLKDRALELTKRTDNARGKYTDAKANYEALKKLFGEKDPRTMQAKRELDEEEKKYKAAKKESDLATFKAELVRAISTAINRMTDALTKGVDTAIDDLVGGYARVNARIQGAQGLDTFQAMVDKTQSNIGLNPFVSQKDTINNIKKIVDSGVAYNVEQRAFLASLSDKIATTFDAFDSNLLRIIRLQQADTTGARLGMEARLTQFFNKMYQDTSYLSNGGGYDSVTQNLTEAMSQMTRNESIAYEYTVQKWLGSLSSLGFSTNAVNSISQAINALSTGDINALNSKSDMQTLLTMSAAKAGLDIGKILTNGMDSTTTNRLLKSMVGYLRDIAKDEKNLVVRQAYGDIFGMSMSDFRALSNLTNNDISSISGTTLGYTTAMNELNNQFKLIQTTNRTPLNEMMSNIFNNFVYTSAAEIARNPLLYTTWEINKFVEEATGGINLPFLSAAGFGLDLNANLNQVAKLGMIGISSITMIPKLVNSLTARGGFNLDEWGNASEFTVRGKGYTGVSAGSLLDTSFSAQIGNASGRDAFNAQAGTAAEDALENSKTLTSVQEEEMEVPEKNTDDIYEIVDNGFSRLAEALADIRDTFTSPLYRNEGF